MLLDAPETIWRRSRGEYDKFYCSFGREFNENLTNFSRSCKDLLGLLQGSCNAHLRLFQGSFRALSGLFWNSFEALLKLSCMIFNGFHFSSFETLTPLTLSFRLLLMGSWYVFVRRFMPTHDDSYDLQRWRHFLCFVCFFFTCCCVYVSSSDVCGKNHYFLLCIK